MSRPEPERTKPMSYFHTRPDPTTKPPDIRTIQLQPPMEREPTINCIYCGANNKIDGLECRKCGAPLDFDSKGGGE